MLSVRILSVESYQTNPVPDLDPTFSEFRGSDIRSVPVIRIFGPTSTGDKACLHIHGVFPYIYVPCTTKENINSFMHRLSSSIDNALNTSSGKSTYKTQHVYKIQQVCGIPIYGYHEKEHLFFKIYFYNPSITKKVADLFQNGAICNQTLQPHEAHIPFVLQFMIDYNLYGMNFINVKDVKHRWNSLTITKNKTDQIHNSESYDSQKYLPTSILCQSICALEVDTHAENILNREAIIKGIELNPGLTEIWNEERARRVQAGLEDVKSQFLYPRTSDERTVLPNTNDNYQEQRLFQRLLNVQEDNEDTISSLKESPYPLPVQDNDNILKASCVENHFKSTPTQKRNKQQQQNYDELKELPSCLLLESLSNEDKTILASSLNENDMAFVEILANLAENDEDKKIVDNDSILGSQFLENDKEFNENDEQDDENNQLNLTNLDLTRLSSWKISMSTNEQLNTLIQGSDKSDEKNNETDVDKSLSTLTFPQFDGANDFLETPKHTKRKKMNAESDDTNKLPLNLQSKKTKKECVEQSNIEKQNLDVPSSSTLSNKNLGAAVIMNEKRICTYRSKSPVKGNVVYAVHEEGMYNLETNNCDKLIESKNINSEYSERKKHKQKNFEGLIQKSSRNYTPLNLIISSSSSRKSVKSAPEKLCNSESMQTVQKRNLHVDIQLKQNFNVLTSTAITNNMNKPSTSGYNPNLINKPKESQQKESHIIHEIEEMKYVNALINSPLQIDNLNVFENDLEENILNTTFTQYIEEKIKSENQISQSNHAIADQRKRKPVTIMTKFNPPTREHVLRNLTTCDISKSTQLEPFFSNKLDLIKQKELASNTFNAPPIASFNSSVEGITGIKLWRRMKVNEFYPSGSNIKSSCIKKVLAGYNLLTIQPLFKPPSVKVVKAWLKSKRSSAIENEQIECSNTSTNDRSSNSDSFKSNTNTQEDTLINALMYKHNKASPHVGISHGQIECSLKEQTSNVSLKNLQHARTVTMHQYITLFSLEVHIVTREDLNPDPQHDPIEAIFYAIQNDVPIDSDKKQMEYGALAMNTLNNKQLNSFNSHIPLIPTSIKYVENEEDLLNNLITIIRHYDPDILLGWEVEVSSWGYVFQRALRLGFNLFILDISRTPNNPSTCGFQTPFKEEFEVKVPGRLILNIWKIMRHEMALLNYSFESIMYNVMKERISCPNYKTLTTWWRHTNITLKSRVIDHYVIRASGNLKILSQLDIIGRTSEYARIFGIQFYEVFSRGSQFRVESMMLRLAKPFNFIPVSPSVQQRARMRAPASLPLIMEPESKLYTDPLIVLDFQSLYPSIIIAYNYCFSTCLGRIEHIGQSVPFEFGAAHLKVDKKAIFKLQGKINYAPCGVAFVKSEVREGVLPRMLSEILNTRLMVKNSMKLHPSDNHNLHRILHSQQMGLKLIANVTYGYTAANFSGRMPCIEIGDSVVSKGRDTLEHAIKIVEATPKWGAKVVYGDTDSLFILLPGKSREEAFKIGTDIADTVTAANPPPVKLKFEKVLQPSILQTKKRYCGYMYETPDQKNPEYFAKGIETVRRDGCPAVSKILEKSLKILFDTLDLSLIKMYTLRQFNKILRRRVSIEDLTFAKEFRGLNGYKTNAFVPALELTKRLMRKDPCAVPRTGERVRYVIVAGAPNQTLIQCVRTPWEVMCDPGLYPNSIYYITKVIIPPLNRCFNLFGIDINYWYQEMSHKQSYDKMEYFNTKNPKSTICQFFNTTICNVCNEPSTNEICSDCMAQPSRTILALYEKIRWLERTYQQINEICHSCVGRRDDPNCASLDCPILYRVHDARKNLVQVSYLENLIRNEGSSTVNTRDNVLPTS